MENSTRPSVLILRADAGRQIGSGHVMRCLALAQAWQDRGGRSVFVSAEAPSTITERLQSEGMLVEVMPGPSGCTEDAESTAEIARRHQANWVAIDGYRLDSAYQRALKDAGFKLLCVDDHANAESYSADLVLNHNLHAEECLYQSRSAHTRLLLGPRFAMLRREFQAWRNWKRETKPDACRVLVTMGGSDPDNVTLEIIRALLLLNRKDLEVTVVAGGSNPHVESLEEECAKLSGPLRVERNATNMPELLAWADVAISGAGTTCWEMCLLGLPALLVDLAENQVPVARELNRCGAAIHMGSTKTISHQQIAGELEQLLGAFETRVAMSQRARELVDGMGAQRVVSAMRSELRLRQAEEKDCRLLWEWANDPAVRAASFSQDRIPWERHQEWFGAKLADRNALIYVALNMAQQPIGHIRYQMEGQEATLSISLSPQFRNLGYGEALLAEGTTALFRNTSATTISAYVKPGNEASLKLFRRAGFATGQAMMIRGQAAVHFTLRKNGV